MSKSPEDKIEEKLRQLELSMKEESSSNLPASGQKGKNLSPGYKKPLSPMQESEASKADMTVLKGFGAVLVGILILFSNLRVSSGWFGWGFMGAGSGQGLFLLLFLIGFGFLFYDFKNKLGWGLMAGGLCGIVFTVIVNLHIYLNSMSFFSLLLIVLPLAIGGGLIAKGMKRHKEIEEDSSL